MLESGTAQQKTFGFLYKQNKKHQEVVPQRKLSSSAYMARCDCWSADREVVGTSKAAAAKPSRVS